MSESEVHLIPNEEIPGKAPKKSKRSKFKVPSTIVIILAVLFFVIFLTWVLQGKEISGGYNVGGQQFLTTQAVGLLGSGRAIVNGFGKASGIIFYLFVLGWFLDVMLSSGSLEKGVSSLIKGLEGKELILVPLMFMLFAFGGTTFGMQEETLGLYVIIIPFFLLAGFDTMTGLLVILLGTTTGIAASVVNPFSVGVAYDSIAIPGQIYSMGDGIFFRLVVFIIFSIIGAMYVTFYAWRIKNQPEISLTASSHNEDLNWAKETFEVEDESLKMSKRQVWGLVVFGLTFLMMFVMLIPWTSFFNFTTPSDGYPAWISWLMNGFMLPGQWDFPELIIMFSISTLILAAIFKMKGHAIVESFWRGSKDMLSVAIIIGVARAIPEVLNYSGLDIYIATSIGSAMGNVGGLGWTYLMFFVFLVFSILIPSTSGLATATMGVFSSSASAIFLDPNQLRGVIISTVVVYSIAIGIINMIIPTQAVVMASAEKAHVPYATMVKPVSLYMGIMIFITLVAIIPMTMIIY